MVAYVFICVCVCIILYFFRVTFVCINSDMGTYFPDRISCRSCNTNRYLLVLKKQNTE